MMFVKHCTADTLQARLSELFDGAKSLYPLVVKGLRSIPFDIMQEFNGYTVFLFLDK